MTLECDTAVVGGGPAGVHAAVALHRAGVRTLLIDAAARLGGQIYRPLPSGWQVSDPAALGSAYQDGETVRALAAESGVPVLHDTRVWGAFGGFDLGIVGPQGGDAVHAEQLILATGAFDRTAAFPGWTLPGVLTAGGAQALAKSMRMRPGHAAVVAGTGPLLPLVALQLAGIGMTVRAVVELGSMRGAPGLPRMLAKPSLALEGLQMLRALRAEGIPVLRRHLVVEAHGDTRLTGVSVAPVGPDGAARRDATRRFETDVLAINFGFVPNTALSRQLGVNHRRHLGSEPVPILDESLATSTEDVFVAGDCAGIGGSVAARHEGTLAALGVLRRRGVLSATTYRRRAGALRLQLARLDAFQAGTTRVFAAGTVPPPPSPGSVVCRCEDVSRETLEAVVADGARTPNELKLLTRAGMGRCRGAICASPVSAMLERLGADLGMDTASSARAPIVPVRFGELVDSTTAIVGRRAA